MKEREENELGHEEGEDQKTEKEDGRRAKGRKQNK